MTATVMQTLFAKYFSPRPLDTDLAAKMAHYVSFCVIGPVHNTKNDKIIHQYHIYNLCYESATESWPGHCIV